MSIEVLDIIRLIYKINMVSHKYPYNQIYFVSMKEVIHKYLVNEYPSSPVSHTVLTSINLRAYI